VAFAGEHAATPGVEAGIIFEQADAGFDCIERRPAAGEHCRAGIESRA
jgi:hypothetical protein